MTDEPPPEPTPTTLTPLVDWMSRHGWKVLAALFAIQLLFHAYAVGAQSFSASVGARPVTERGRGVAFNVAATKHTPRRAEGFPVLLRMAFGNDVTALQREQIDVAPTSE